MRNTTEIKNTKGDIFYKTTGTVKNFNNETGYGFIFSIDEPDNDIYVHATQIITVDEKVLTPGDKVEFIYKSFGDKGLRAYEVKKIK